jgi:hypothetical protein
MLSLQSSGLSRREVVRIGGLSALGLGLPTLLRNNATASNLTRDQSFGRAKNVLFLWLQGGPPQHETFDPKPDAPAEIRGEFKPIATNVPGIDFCELLPRSARIADKLAVIRSISTANDLHDASGYWVLTGKKYLGTQSRQISPTDWPYMGSIIKMLKPSDKLPGLSSVWLPDVMRLNDNVTPAGQTGGFLGKQWDPDRVIFDAWAESVRIEGLSLPDDLPPIRLDRRRSLLDQVDSHFRQIDSSGAPGLYDIQARNAYELLSSGKARQAFDISSEPESVRRLYGNGPWARCLILGRRLIEAGARLVHVNWPREGGDTAVSNPMWDTHAQNSDRLQNVLCPLFDVGFTGLIEDMSNRGLLDETLVVAIGEFGRTPKINRNGGRDHWGHVFSCVLAGAGIESAQVYGSSDRSGAFPATNKVEPQDLVATIFHLLGIDTNGFFRDATDRPIRVTDGEPLWKLIGTGTAEKNRQTPAGDLAFVPEFSNELIIAGDFPAKTVISPAEPGRRIQGWQAQPMQPSADHPLVVKNQNGKAHFRLTGPNPLKKPFRALIAQEFRNPRAGQFTIEADLKLTDVSVALPSSSSISLIFYGYLDGQKKDLSQIREFKRMNIPLEKGAGSVRLIHRLRSQDDGASEIERGVGVMILVEAAPTTQNESFEIIVDQVSVKFDPRPRDENVTV